MSLGKNGCLLSGTRFYERMMSSGRAMGWCFAIFVGLALAFPVQAQGTTEKAGSPSSLRSLFSPWDDIEGAIISIIGQAQRQVLVQAYLLTSRPITKALLAAHQRGVVVRLLADKEMAQRTGAEQLQVLSRGGIEVWLETRYAAAHNKVILVDAEGPAPVLITGSYNFTWSAQARNAENVLIVTGDVDIVRRYAENWRRHRSEATVYEASGTAEPTATEPKTTTSRAVEPRVGNAR